MDAELETRSSRAKLTSPPPDVEEIPAPPHIHLLVNVPFECHFSPFLVLIVMAWRCIQCSKHPALQLQIILYLKTTENLIVLLM